MSQARFRLARARHRRAHRAGEPIVVFSQPKTGSTSVAEALRAARVGPVFHAHDLDPTVLDAEEAGYRWAGRPWRTWDGQHLLRRPATAQTAWRVVSITRDPIAQTVSAFFQLGMRHGFVREDARVSDLLERFGDRLDRLPLHWFDSHLRPALGIDVFDGAFDHAGRFQRVDTPAVHLLVLRCEDLDLASAPLGELVGTGPVSVARANTADQHHHADLYRAFRRALRPSREQLDRAYSAPSVQHFYRPSEIDRFRASWTQEPGTDPTVPLSRAQVDR